MHEHMVGISINVKYPLLTCVKAYYIKQDDKVSVNIVNINLLLLEYQMQTHKN